MTIRTDGMSVRANFPRITYSDIYSFTPHFSSSPNDEFMLTAHFKEDYMKRCMENEEVPSRKRENLIPDYFLFESDTLSLDKQVELINNMSDDYKKYIRSVTFSGNKSIHVLFGITNAENLDSHMFSEVWNLFMMRAGIVNEADEACATIGRLTRNPNGLRSDTQVRQTCYYCSPNSELYDVLPLVRIVNEYEAFEKERMRFQNLTRMGSQNHKSITDTLEGIKKSTKSKEIYEMIQTQDFPSGRNYMSDAAALFKFLTETCGYEREEVISWIRENFLIPVSEVHPSNISANTAKGWSL